MNYIMHKGDYIKKGGRMEVIDIAKGLGILFVVWSHAKGPLKTICINFICHYFF